MSPVVRVLGCVAALLATQATAGQPGSPPVAKKAAPKCSEPEQVVAVLAGARRAEALAALRAEEPRLLAGSEEEKRFAELLPNLGDRELFLADVNNDGRDELIVTTSEGSGHYLVLFVFANAGKGARLLADPQGPSEGLAGWHEYHNPLFASPQQLVGRTELIVRHCGRVYLNFAGWVNRHWFRDTFVWEGGALARVCDPGWVGKQRELFQALLERQLVAEAHAQLEGVQQACRAQLDDGTWLWMQSDLALAALRWHAPDLCLAQLDAALQAPAFARASQKVRRALETNRGLCRAERAKLSEIARGYDASWTLALAGQGTDVLTWDPRFAHLVAALVPDVLVPEADGLRFRDAFELNIFGPPEDVQVRDGRYVTFAACRAHDCGGNTAFGWIDVAGRRSVFGLLGGPVASRTVTAADLPAELWRDAEAWLRGPGDELTVLDVSGARQVQRK